MKLSIVAGATSQTVNLFIQDSSKTDGSGLTGLVYNTSGLACYRVFPRGSATAITLATLSTATSAYSSGGFKEVDSANMPGVYRFDVPDSSLAAGNGRSAVFILRGATNMAPCVLEIELTGWDNQDAVHGGMSALPNTACTTNNSLITSGTGTDQLSVSGGNAKADVAKINGVATSSVTTVSANVGTTQPTNFTGTAASALVKVDVQDFGGAAGAFTAGKPAVTLAAADVSGNVAADLQTIKTQAVTCSGGVTVPAATLASTTNITAGTVTTVSGNVNGSVGSVTAAVTLTAGDSPVIATGTATAGASTTITLQAALGANDLVKGCTVKITSGTGAKQARTITGYVDSTKVATVDRAWATTPDATSVYAVLYRDAPKLDANLGVVLADAPHGGNSARLTLAGGDAGNPSLLVSNAVTGGVAARWTANNGTYEYTVAFGSPTSDARHTPAAMHAYGTFQAGSPNRYARMVWGASTNLLSNAELGEAYFYDGAALFAFAGHNISYAHAGGGVGGQWGGGSADGTVEYVLYFAQGGTGGGDGEQGCLTALQIDGGGSHRGDILARTLDADLGGKVLGGAGGGGAITGTGVRSDVRAWGGAATAGALPPDSVFIRSGTAQAGSTASTIKLDAGASATDNLYQNEIVQLRGGTGAGQAAIISAYNGTTKVATINGAWAVTPDATTTFTILPMGAIPATVSGSVNLASTGLDAVVVESGLNARQALAILCSEAAGAWSGAGTVTFLGAGVSATRIVGTWDATGRHNLTLSPPP